MMDQMTTYHIRVKGHLDRCWSDWFPGMEIVHEANGDTTIAGPVVDQSALHGMLARIRDLNLPLLVVAQIRDE